MRGNQQHFLFQYLRIMCVTDFWSLQAKILSFQHSLLMGVCITFTVFWHNISNSYLWQFFLCFFFKFWQFVYTQLTQSRRFLILSTDLPQQNLSKGRQNSNFNKNIHSRIENSSQIWEMRIFDSKIKFFSEKELPLPKLFTNTYVTQLFENIEWHETAEAVVDHWHWKLEYLSDYDYL